MKTPIKAKKWVEISVEVHPEAVEAVSEIFHRHGYGGVAIEAPIVAGAEVEDYHFDPQQPVTVKTYLPRRGAAARRRRIEAALWHTFQVFPHPLSPISATEVAEEDWAESWKAHFHALRVGEHLVVCPSWESFTPRDGDLVVSLDPGMAFGTGYHPSTRLCLLALEKYLRPGVEVLDLGTGSGILAIAAAKLGAGSVLALDIDAEAVGVAAENVEQNGLAEAIQVAHGTLEWGLYPGRFDLIVANLTARLLGGLAGPIRESLKPGGLLIAAGIVSPTLDWVSHSLEDGGAGLIEMLQEDDWHALVMEGI